MASPVVSFKVKPRVMIPPRRAVPEAYEIEQAEICVATSPVRNVGGVEKPENTAAVVG